MKIGGNNPIDGKDLISRIQEAGKKTDTETRGGAPDVQGGPDRISLSDKAKGINELKSLINQLPEIRMDRVDSIKQAVDAGTYDADSLKTAWKMLQEI